MKKRLPEIILFCLSAFIITFGFTIDFLRSRPFSLGWMQIGLIIFGLFFSILGYLSKNELLTPLLKKGIRITKRNLFNNRFIVNKGTKIRSIILLLEKLIKKYHFFIFLFLLILYLLPLVIFQENSYITIHDNLDSLIPWNVVLKESKTMFIGNAVINQLMNGLPRSVIPSGYNIVTVLFWLFPPFIAYLINHIIIHILAYIGMYLLLKTHFIKDNNLIASGAAFCFSILPFYSSFGLSVAGQPLLFYGILNIRSKIKVLPNVLIIILFAFYSSLIYSGAFILAILGIWFIIEWIIKRPNWQLFSCIILLFGLYLFIDHAIISLNFTSQYYISHRTEWVKWLEVNSRSFYHAFIRSINFFISGQYHAASLHNMIILFFIPISIILGRKNKFDLKKLILFVFICFLISLIYGFLGWSGLIFIKKRIPLINTIGMRFYFISPTLWYICFALSLAIIKNTLTDNNQFRILLISCFILFQSFFIIINNDEFIKTIKVNLIHNENANEIITYKQFYSENLFSKIEDFVDYPQETYRVISIGLHPGIAQYNGFYTLDGYQTNYPLEYKKSFRKIIANELEKNEGWKFYFDSWGSRCYIFVAELGSAYVTDRNPQPIQNLELNTESLINLADNNNVYVFSISEIINFNSNKFDYLGSFENSDSFYKIYLYKTKNNFRVKDLY